MPVLGVSQYWILLIEGNRKMLKSSISLACATTLMVVAHPADAKDPSPKDLMAMSAGCAYVVSVAEGSNAELNYGSGDWLGIVSLLEQKTGLDGEQALELAKAKYKRRARKMGADETYKYMLGRAKECDREMAVFYG